MLEIAWPSLVCNFHPHCERIAFLIASLHCVLGEWTKSVVKETFLYFGYWWGGGGGGGGAERCVFLFYYLFYYLFYFFFFFFFGGGGSVNKRGMGLVKLK